MESLNVIYKNFASKFWNEDVWLPPNTTWNDLTPGRNGINYTDYRHLVYPIPMAAVMLVLRYVLERYWFAPVGRRVGIKYTRSKKATPNVILEKAYNQNKHPSHRQIVGLAKQLDLTERQIERWLRLRKSQDKPSTLTKFCENAWRCLYYTYSFIYGVYVLWDKPWIWDINYCWYGYPHQGYTDDIWYYYMISMSFYWSLCFSQFWDVKRKDFWQMFIHHIATILLMALSWICNLFRIGTLVLVVHDCADILLELAKMLKYMGWQSMCDCVFGIFTLLWIITRTGFYPFWIIRSTSIEAPKILPMFPAYYIFNTLLLLLLVLHIIWTWLILRIAYHALRAGQMEGDIRSSSSSTDDSIGVGDSTLTSSTNSTQRNSTTVPPGDKFENDTASISNNGDISKDLANVAQNSLANSEVNVIESTSSSSSSQIHPTTLG
ncbi:ceramide synthase 6 [Chrysoperla carnea]|uniref:ceramide synthase 6 n=1 Tax=Chrysoperla carnea TaxID=189513 RepID=UPI001D06D53E|nr:ceramide synthase 6 [Chrysoperla carnea]XP_044741193.1 ceramide synthase 6 [Chrysoperla carnea]XP_044741194.1 ceramide synthase 6 [Chrysoperla carnea]XP_044741195.1 ceramide synthase 6 [Chrysoperla carnea]XP_044741196.1 ceramide synthase 6 [Chrysoperla carnea]